MEAQGLSARTHMHARVRTHRNLLRHSATRADTALSLLASAPTALRASVRLKSLGAPPAGTPGPKWCEGGDVTVGWGGLKAAARGGSGAQVRQV